MLEFTRNRKCNLKIKDRVYLVLLFFSLLGYVLAFSSVYSTIMSLVLFVYTVIITPSLKFKYSAYQFWGVIVIVFSLISSLWAIRAVLSYFAVFSFVKIFILTYSMYRFCYTKENFIKLLRIFIFINVILIFFVLFYFDISILGKKRMGDVENGFNGNGIAISLVFALYSIYLIFILKKLSFFRKISYSFWAVIFFVFSVFTGSRTALVMLVLPLIIYMFLKSKYKIIALVSISVFMSGMYYIIMEVPQFYNILGVRIHEAVDIVSGNIEGGDSSRFLLFLYGVEWFKEHPDATLITDKVNEPLLFANQFIDKKRLMMELFTEKAVDEGLTDGDLTVMPSEFILSIIKKQGVEYLVQKGIKYIAISRYHIMNNKPLLLDLKKKGIRVYVYNVNFKPYADEDYVTRYEMDYVYGIYADKWSFK